MKKIKLTENFISQCKKIADDKEFSGNFLSITNNGILQGTIGEQVVLHSINNAKLIDCLNYDLLIWGKTIDVKTRSGNTEPSPIWEVRLPEYSLKRQQCYGYIFTCLNNDYSEIWVLGGISKKDFINKSYQRMGKAESGYEFKTSQYNLKIQELNNIDGYIRKRVL